MTRLLGELDTCARSASDAARALLGEGFSAAELAWPADRDAAAVLERGVSASGIEIGLIDISPVAGQNEPSVGGQLLSAIDAARRLRARKLRIRLPASTVDGSLTDRLRDIADAADRRGLGLVLAVPGGDPMPVLAAVAHPAVTVEIEPLAQAGDRAAASELIRQTMGRIGHVRVDLTAPGAAARPHSEIADLLRALRAAGYNDSVTVAGGAAPAEWGTSRDQDRLDRVRAALAGEDLDALVCGLSENVLALTGYWSMNGTCVAVVPRDGEPALLVPRGEETWAAASGWPTVLSYPSGRLADPPAADALRPLLRELADAAGLRDARIGIERDQPFVVPAHTAHETAAVTPRLSALLESAVEPAEIVPADQLIHCVRAVKTAREIAAIRRAAAAADEGLRAFREATVPDRLDHQVATAVELAVRDAAFERGASRARAWAYVMSGPQISQAYLPFQVPTARAMSAGELVLLEMAVVVEGYWQDLSRTLVVGEAGARQRELAAAVRAAWEAAAAAAVPGATGGDVDGAARNVLTSAGLGDNFVHGTGHGVGLAFHEPQPILSPGRPDVIARDMVLAIEPGVYLPGFGGVRNEDDCLVTDTGAESLVSDGHAI
ncbi:MAG: Xaa-Pro dipeptidase [Thermoleophilaceae bacterium]|jgi:Xaa-Pro aminopeptidase|nr:Xaa-Pro dipeptidase [Thermoleophilaceae bacterium]